MSIKFVLLKWSNTSVAEFCLILYGVFEL